jgi:multidrug efflux pump subunit AcrA (membrane-fusion protein)
MKTKSDFMFERFASSLLPVLLLIALPSFAAVTPEEAAATVILTESGVKNLRIETVEVEETDFEETVFALGRIQIAPANRAVVSSRVPGRALKVNAHIDRRIEAGSEAVVVESRQPGDPPPRVSLPAPIGGLVMAVNVAVGQPVEPSASLVEIVDLTEIHALAAVPEHLASRLRPGMKAHIRVLAVQGKEFTAELSHVGSQADAKSGTIEAAFHVENADYALRPGMRAEFSIVTSKREGVMSIPRQALQGDALNRSIFRKHYDTSLKNTFVRVDVETGAMNDRFVEITRGLVAGDEVVTNGAYSLAFAGKGSVSLKEALDAAHGHEHKEDGSEISAGSKAKGDAGGGHRQEDGGHLSPLTLFSLISNALLLVLLVVAMLRKGEAPKMVAASKGEAQP